MSHLELIVEQQIREAMQRGEFDDLPGAGRPLADLDRPRQPGWFAEQLVRRERSRVLRDEALSAVAARRVQFWRAPTLGILRELVDAANRELAGVNARLEPQDRIESIDFRAVAGSWRAQRAP